jgi:short-subunit dehydrogenase
MRIDGKVVLITGASEGIGAACASEFARAGARLSLTARSEEGLRRSAGSAESVITPGDITSEALRRQVVERTLQRFGSIDILINNAGVGSYTPAWSSPMDEVRRLMELNFFALLGLTQLVTPHMRSQGSGTIVNVGSIAGKMVLPWMTLYSTSKYAVGALTEGLRMELHGSHVHAMVVCPGYVKTSFQQHALAGETPADIKRAKRFAITPERCAADIRRGVERGARTVVTPKSGWLLIMAMRLFPGFVQARMAAMNGTA